jgi:hypothetical protein
VGCADYTAGHRRIVAAVDRCLNHTLKAGAPTLVITEGPGLLPRPFGFSDVLGMSAVTTPGPRSAPLPVRGLLIVAVLCVLAVFYTIYMRQCQSEAWRIIGSRDPTGAWYGFWSGMGGSLPDIALFTGVTAWYLHHTCHMSPWCLRWGKFEAAGGVFKLCRHHHPDIAALTHLSRHDMIHKLHREHLDRTSRRTPAKPRA